MQALVAEENALRRSFYLGKGVNMNINTNTNVNTSNIVIQNSGGGTSGTELMMMQMMMQQQQNQQLMMQQQQHLMAPQYGVPQAAPVAIGVDPLQQPMLARSPMMAPQQNMGGFQSEPSKPISMV
jgi:hypothetical protein